MSSPEIPPDAKTFEEMVWDLNRISGEPRCTALITHLYIEYLLDWIIRRKLRNPDKIIKRTFFSKLELVESFDFLPTDLMHDLWIVNEVRNLFAHRIDIKSQDFLNKFTEKVHQMMYYNDNVSRFEGKDTFLTYYMLMPRVYAVLKNEFDQL